MIPYILLDTGPALVALDLLTKSWTFWAVDAGQPFARLLLPLSVASNLFCTVFPFLFAPLTHGSLLFLPDL